MRILVIPVRRNDERCVSKNEGAYFSPHIFHQLFAICLGLLFLATGATVADEPYRPEPGKFPLAEKAKPYTGELTFVDHAHRRGSLRVPVEGSFYTQPGRPFAMLPYGVVRYHGAPAELKDIPLGTVLHGRFYLPPDPTISLVPNANEANHAILLEDEPSFCLREGKVWRLRQIEMRGDEGMIIASREAKEAGSENGKEERFTVDDTTRYWRGREKLGLDEVTAEGLWPTDGMKQLDGQSVLLGLTWQPMNDFWKGAVNGFHVSDIWLDEVAMRRATQFQTKIHKEFIQGRWMPAWVDHVEYGKFGAATVTATLFGGMDPSLYADFKKRGQAQMGAATETLKHANGGSAGHAHMAIRGPLQDVIHQDVIHQDVDIPLGSSGIQIRMQVDLVLEGFRPGSIVRIRPMNWPADPIPREEFLGYGGHAERFPSPDIFTK